MINSVREYKRLTARNIEGFAYLVNVKPDEQAVESPYPNTLRCILDNFERLAQYEDTGLSPAEVAELKNKAKSKNDLNCRICDHYTVKFSAMKNHPCDTCKDCSNWAPIGEG